MRKLLALLMAVAMLCSIAVGCSDPNPANPDDPGNNPGTQNPDDPGSNPDQPDQPDTPLEPAKATVETEHFIFTLNSTGNTYTVKATDEGKTLEEAVIPSNVDGYKVTTIADYCFIRCDGLKKVTIPEGVTVIGMSAFYNCTALTEVTIPSTLMSIKQNCFQGCTSLTSVELPDTMVSLGTGAFSDCTALTEINLPAALQAIPSKGFENCDLRSVIIGKNVRKIGASAFSNNKNLTELKLSASLSEIDAYAFSYCAALTEVLFPRNNELVLGDYAFVRTGLLKVYLPYNISLGTYTFMQLAWDDSVENPGDAVNKGASRCTAIYYESAEGSRGINAFGYTWNRPDLGFRIYVPQGSLLYYMSANPGDESWMRCVVNSVNGSGSVKVLQEYDIDTTFPNGFPVAE